MAKIYETQKDFEQDKLKDQAADMNLKAGSQAILGMSSMVLGSVINDYNTKQTGGLKFASLALIAVGAIEFVRSLFTGSKASDLTLKKERLGPPVVVLPPEMGGSTIVDSAQLDNPSCGCKLKHTQAVQPKTLLEQAVKSEIPLAK